MTLWNTQNHFVWNGIDLTHALDNLNVWDDLNVLTDKTESNVMNGLNILAVLNFAEFQAFKTLNFIEAMYVQSLLEKGRNNFFLN